MLIALGFSMIAVFMYLILAKRLTPTLALVLVPLAFALVVTATGISAPTEDGVVDSIMDSIKSFAPTAALLFFAIIFFGTMIDVGLFDPLIRFVLKAVRNDPVRTSRRSSRRTTGATRPSSSSGRLTIRTAARHSHPVCRSHRCPKSVPAQVL